MRVMVARRSVSRFAATLCALVAGLVLAAGPAYAASAPVVERVWASEVNRSTARINALVNPSETDTAYRFEYGPDGSYGASVPVPNGDLGAGSEGVEVSEFLSGLQDGGTYHYRVVATNSEGVTTSGDETFTTFSSPSPESTDTCSNAVFMVGFSAGLPDCRAYEMVSPVVKNGGDVSGEAYGQTLAAEGGERVVFTSKTGFGEVSGSGNAGYTQYISERGEDGWVSRGITPLPNVGNGGQVLAGNTQAIEFSPDLRIAGLYGYSLAEGPASARPKSENLYLESTATGQLFAAITDASDEGEPVPYPPSLIEILGQAWVEQAFGRPVPGGGSASLDVVTFMSRVNFTSEAHGFGYKAYVYEDGMVKLLGVLPDGSIPPNGSNLIFAPEGSATGRDDRAIAEKDTVSTDGSRILFEVNEFPGQIFMRKDGTKTVLVSESEASEQVTAENVELEAATPDLEHIVFSTSTRLSDSTPEGGGTYMYMYTDSPDPGSEGNLTYIGNALGESAVIGMSEDGTRIYYHDAYGVDLWESGHTRQVAPEAVGVGEARVTPDGGELAFMSHVGPSDEMYVYNEVADTLKCVSCPLTHAAATAGIETSVDANDSGTELAEPDEPRFFSRDGRYVFFNTVEALVPQDTNGVTDAYEYDTQTDRLSLLSTGAGEDGTWFVEASADGRDAYLVTRQKLTGWDPDKLVDVYDARVGGGLPEPQPPGVACDGDACQGIPSAAPVFNTASGFAGLGNPTFAPGAKVKAKAKPNRLSHALAVCRKKHDKRKRSRCERLARRRYHAGRSSRDGQLHATPRAGR
jgi:hypothetical protein